MPDYSETIVVDASPRVVYDHWRRFEDYPSFMSDVVEVRELGGGRLLWRGHVGDDDAVWETEVVDQAPETGLSWRSINGPSVAESVELTDLGDGRTRVTWTRRRERDKDDLGELFLGAFGADTTTLRGNLEQFKRRVELRSVAEGTGERAIGATRDRGAAVVRGEAPGIGPATGPEGSQGTTPPAGSAFDTNLSAPGAVTATPEPLPPGFTGNRGTANAPADGAGIN